jgi:hypothetical protein
MKELSTDDPREHAANIRRSIDDLISHLRRDIAKVNAPKGEVLFETAAEVLVGLRTAFEHYENQSEPAMREPTPGAEISPRFSGQETYDLAPNT